MLKTLKKTLPLHVKIPAPVERSKHRGLRSTEKLSQDLYFLFLQNFTTSLPFLEILQIVIIKGTVPPAHNCS